MNTLTSTFLEDSVVFYNIRDLLFWKIYLNAVIIMIVIP